MHNIYTYVIISNMIGSDCSYIEPEPKTCSYIDELGSDEQTGDVIENIDQLCVGHSAASR